MWNLYLRTISYLTINKCNITNSFCYLLCLVFFGVSRTSFQQQSANKFGFYLPLYLFPMQDISSWNFSPCSSETDPVFPGKKNPSGIAGNGVSTCCTTRHGKWKVAPPRFQRSFLIFLFLRKLLHTLSIASQALLSAVFSLHMKRESWQKLQRTDENALFYLGLAFEWKIFALTL